MSKLDLQKWVTSGAGWTSSPRGFQWEGLSANGGHKPTVCLCHLPSALGSWDEARLLWPTPPEMISVSAAGLPGGSSAGIIFDTPRVPDPPSPGHTIATG